MIKINTGRIKEANHEVSKMIGVLSGVQSAVVSLRNRVDSGIAVRRDIRCRLDKSGHALEELERRLRELESFVNRSTANYADTENQLVRQAASIGTVRAAEPISPDKLIQDMKALTEWSSMGSFLIHGYYDLARFAYRTPSEYLKNLIGFWTPPAPTNAKTREAPDTTTVRTENEDFVQIADDGVVYYGGNQKWFETKTEQFGGCGPTAAANILAYMAMTNPELAKLYDYDLKNITKSDYKKFMQQVYTYVTPMEIPLLSEIKNEGKSTFGLPPSLGITSLSAFAEGVEAYVQSKGVHLKAHWSDEKPTFDNAVAYIREGLKKNCPVALLNMFDSVDMQYTNPQTKETKTMEYSKHWVTVTGITENQQTGEVTLEVSTWGGKATLNFNELWDHDLMSQFIPEGIMYFEPRS